MTIMKDQIACAFEVKRLAAAGQFEGYASVFDTLDQGHDVMKRGAFHQSLKSRGAAEIKLLWQHDPAQPIGIIEDIREDQHGLYVKGRLLLSVARAREAYDLLKTGALDGLSIGFQAVRATRDNKTGVRHLLQVALWEISMVTFPMNTQARIRQFKSQTVNQHVKRTNSMTTSDVKAAERELGQCYEAFKAADQQAGAGNDPLTEEKMARINGELDRLGQKLDRLYAGAARPEMGRADRREGPDAGAGYKQAFYEGFVRKGQDGALQHWEEKALNVGTDADGGYAVPDLLDRNIEKLLQDLSPLRREAATVQVGSAKYRKLVNVGGITSGWIGETDARLETDTPQLQEVVPPLGEIYANPAATQTMLDDALFDVEGWLAGELAEEFALQEGAAFVNGDGIGKPKGFLTYTASTLGDGARPFGQIEALKTGVAGDFAASDPSDQLIDLVHRLKASYRQGAAFFMNTNLLADIRKFKDADGQYLWRPGLEAGQGATLLGYPVVEVADMPDKGAGSLSVAFAQMKRAYTITDRMGLRMLRDPYSHKPYVHFYTTKRVGGAVVNDAAIKLLQFAV